MASTAHAAPIAVTSVIGTGTYTNSLSLLTDGTIPIERTWWMESTNVYWTGLTPTFTFQLDSVYRVDDLLIQVDNNDEYHIEYSLNGSTWSPLYTILNTDGTVDYGMDTFTKADKPFSAVNARYIRVYATDGDGMNAISEVQAFGTGPVPEPATLTLLGSGLLISGVFRKRKESALSN
ncbi:MAG: discoidin domain-containing protein [Chlorobaculum sp.]|nr:discoidin domain-containing protein [Chlorobaculum sp.]